MDFSFYHVWRWPQWPVRAALTLPKWKSHCVTCLLGALCAWRMKCREGWEYGVERAGKILRFCGWYRSDFGGCCGSDLGGCCGSEFGGCCGWSEPGQGPHPQRLQGSAVHVLKWVLRFLFAPAEQHKVPADLSSAGLKADFDATWLLTLVWSKLHHVNCIFVVFETPFWKMKNNLSVSVRSLLRWAAAPPAHTPSSRPQLSPLAPDPHSLSASSSSDVPRSLRFLFASLLCGRTSNNS